MAKKKTAKKAADKMGHKLQQLRDFKHLSQPQLAALSGVSLGTIRNWEQDRRMPRLDTAWAIAKALKVSIDELVEGPAVARVRWKLR